MFQQGSLPPRGGGTGRGGCFKKDAPLPRSAHSHTGKPAGPSRRMGNRRDAGRPFETPAAPAPQGEAVFVRAARAPASSIPAAPTPVLILRKPRSGCLEGWAAAYAVGTAGRGTQRPQRITEEPQRKGDKARSAPRFSSLCPLWSLWLPSLPCPAARGTPAGPPHPEEPRRGVSKDETPPVFCPKRGRLLRVRRIL
jgi:hypothetical protein